MPISTPAADALLFSAAISTGMKGSERKGSGPFSCQFAGRHRSPAVLDRGARLGDFQRDAAAGIARAGQRKAPAKRHGLSIDLQMRPPVIWEKSDDELRAVGAAIVLERLREGER